MAITIPILTDFNGSGISKATKKFQDLEGVGAKAHYALRKAAIPAAAAVAAVGYAAIDAVKAAAEDAAAQDKLAGVLQRTTHAHAGALASVDDFITKMSMERAIADDQLRPALAKLALGTGDLAKAQEGLALATDIAAATGKPLEAVSTALSKAYAGQYSALGKLDPTMKTLVKNGADSEEIFAKLTDRFGGAASDAANTAEGRFKSLGIALDETKESVGAALMPAIEAVLPILQRFGKWAQDHAGIVAALGIAIAALAVSVLAVNAAMSLAAAATAIWTAAQWALNVALNANPIGIVITAIAAFVAGVIIAYNKSETFRNIVDSIGSALASVAGWFNDHVIPAIGTFLSALKKAWDWIDNNAGPVLTAFKIALTAAFAPIFVAITGLQKLLDLLGSWSKGARSAPSFKGGGTGTDVDNNPATPFAMGGIVTRPTFALIGEAGPEAVIPLNRAGNMGMGSVTINVQAGLVSTPDQIGQQIIEAIQSAQRRSGPVFAAA